MVDFRVNIVVDPTRAALGAKKVERSLTRVNNKANLLRRNLGLTFGALAGGAIIFGAIRSMARFEESIAIVRAVTKATDKQFKELSATAQRLGITTRFSATQAADAMVLLARAGFDVNETMEAVADTLLLAQAGNLGLAQAADITASTLRAFRLEVAEVAMVTDVLTATANASNTNVLQLGEGLKFVAPIAKGLGISLKSTAAAMGILSDAGLKSTLAGTGLRRVLAELESPGTNLTKILTAAGLSIDKVRPSVVGLEQALATLRGASITTGDALDVFGQRGGPAFQVLVSNLPGLRKLNEELENSGGEALRVAGIMDKTLNGALFRTRSAIEGVVLAFGEVGTSGALTSSLDALASAFRLVARNAAILLNTAVTLAAAFAAFKLLGFIGALGKAAIASTALNGAMANGTVTLLTSTTAIVGRATALVGSTTAQLAATTASIADVKAKIALASTTASANLTTTTSIGLTAELTALEATATAQTTTLAGARTRLASANVLATRSTGALSKSLIFLRKTLASTVPFLALLAGAAFLLNKKLEDRKKILKEIAVTNLDAFADSGLSRFGQALQKTRKELQEMQVFLDKQKKKDSGFAPSRGQLKFIADREQAIKDTTAAIKEQIEVTKAIADARDRGNITVENTIASLMRQGVALAAVTQEGKNQIALEEELQKLLFAGEAASPEQAKKIADLIAFNAALIDQNKIVASIKGPLEQYNRELVAADAAFNAGRISAGELRQKLLELRDAFENPISDEPFRNALQVLRDMNDATRTAIRLGKDNAAIIALIKQLEQEGPVSKKDIADIETEIKRARELNNERARGIGLIVRRARMGIGLEEDQAALDLQIVRLGDRFNLNAQLIDQEFLLTAAKDLGIISQEQLNQSVTDLQIRSLEASTAMGDGFTRAFLKISQEANDLAKVGESIVNVFANQATDAIIKFAETGSFKIKEFVNDMLQGLIKIIARLLVVQAIQAATGLGGATGIVSGIGAIAGGRAEGGPVQPNRSFVVGEKGPEIFQPERAGNIIPNGGQQAAPAPNVQVINVMSEDDIPSVINEGGADDAIVNVIARNKDRVNQIL